MNIIMKKNRSGDTSKVTKFVEIFPRISKLIEKDLGEKPFHLRGPLNTAALDSVYTVLINCKSGSVIDFAGKYRALVEDAEYTEATKYSTSDESVVKARIQIAEKYLLG